MGTPLTGSTVASTYTGLLKTSDNATITSTLKSLGDGGGNDSALQVSSTAVNTTGDFSVATSKFTVAASSGNTAIFGTLNVTGATTLSGNLSVPGTLNVTGATSLSSLSTSGAATVGTTLGVTGASTLASLGVTGATNLSTLGVSGAATLSSTLDVTGNTTLNGNTTIGNANTDVLIINSDDITLPNISSATIDYSADTVLIRDSSASNKLRSATMAQFTPQCVQTIFQGVNSYTAVSTGSGTAITDLNASITPRSSSSKILVTIVLNYSSTQSQRGVFRLTRNGNEIGSNLNGSSLYGIAPVETTFNNDQITNTVISFYDTSPSSGLNTYIINVFSAGLSGVFTNIYLNRNINDVTYGANNFDRARTSCTMTLQEVLA